MKKIINLLFFIICLSSFCLVSSCVNTDQNKDPKIASIRKETEDLISKISGVVYEFVDDSGFIYYPKGTAIAFSADIITEGIVGIYFDSAESKDAGYERATRIIKNKCDKLISGSEKIEIKQIDNWVVGGTENMLAYFEGIKGVESIVMKKPATLFDLRNIFYRNGYSGLFVKYNICDEEINEYGIIGYFAYGSDEESDEFFVCYLIESYDKIIEYQDIIFIKLEERFNYELSDSPDWGKNENIQYGIYENFVYIASPKSIDLLPGK